MAESDANQSDEREEAATSDEVSETASQAHDEVMSDSEDILEDIADAAEEATEPVTTDSLQAQLDEANDRVLRTQAELENFRKRSRRDLDEQRKYANLPLVSDLLPALDNLDRAVEAAEQNENATGLLEGVKMVASQIQSILEQHHCKRVPAAGSEFDPNVHEALAQEPSDEIAAGSVTRELRVGYQLHDRVIRPSQVMVSTGAAAPAEEQQDAD